MSNLNCLKFRVWNKETNDWLSDVPGTHCFSEYYLDLAGGGLVSFVGCFGPEAYTKDQKKDFYFSNGNVVQGSPYIIQRFTGKVDVKGEDIYEGDILQFGWVNDYYVTKQFIHIGEVFYDNERAAFYIDRDNEFSWRNPDIKLSNMKIIGNIFETPELIQPNYLDYSDNVNDID